jgi:hypothetical protein
MKKKYNFQIYIVHILKMLNNAKYLKQSSSSSNKRILENLFNNEYRSKLKNDNESHKHEEVKSHLQRQLVFKLLFHQNEIDKIKKDHKKILLHTGSLDDDKFDSIFSSNPNIHLNKNVLYDNLLPLKIEKVEYERSFNNNKSKGLFLNKQGNNIKLIKIKDKMLNKSLDYAKPKDRFSEHANRSTKSSISMSNYDSFSAYDDTAAQLDNEDSLEKIEDDMTNQNDSVTLLSKWTKEHKDAYLKLDKVFNKRYKQLQTSKKLQSPISYDSNDYHVKLSSRLPRKKIQSDKQKLIESLQRLSLKEAQLEKIRFNNHIRLKVKNFLDF